MITEWDKLINRIRLETSQRLGSHKNSDIRAGAVVAVKVTLLADSDGNPLVWSVESTNIEPAGKARAILGLL